MKKNKVIQSIAMGILSFSLLSNNFIAFANDEVPQQEEGYEDEESYEDEDLEEEEYEDKEEDLDEEYENNEEEDLDEDEEYEDDEEENEDLDDDDEDLEEEDDDLDDEDLEEEDDEDTLTQPQEPEKPQEIEGELDNEKIEEYNQQVDEYNQQVDQYNEEVDNYNQQIDEQYEQEKADIDQQNQEIDEYNQAEDDKAAAVDAKNNQIQEQYNTDYAQYEQDLNKYEQIEETILQAGYESVEKYNETIDNAYNKPAQEAIEKNADETAVFDINKSYKITKAENNSDSSDAEDDVQQEVQIPKKKYKVEIEHDFEEWETYTTDFEIEEDDIITFESAGAQMENIDSPYHFGFFMHTDDRFTNGIWTINGSILYELANYVTSGWNNGDTHTVSYKDGERTSGDTDLKMVYYYKWKVLKQYPTYTKPEEPQLNLIPTYTPNYKDKLSNPIKGEYLSYLDHLNNLDYLPEPEEPTPEPEPIPEPQPEPEPIPEPEKPQPQPEQPIPTPTPEPDPIPIKPEEPIIIPLDPIDFPIPIIEEEENNEPSEETIIIEEEIVPLSNEPEMPIKDKEVLGVERVIQPVKQVLGAARMANTGDKYNIKERYAIIGGCLFLIALLIIVDIDRKRKS